MECKFALKHIHDESISVRIKQEIDDHITQCAYCQGQIVSSNRVKDFIGDLKPVKRDELFWRRLLNEIRDYRELKLIKWWHPIVDRLPLEPAARRSALAGVACCVALILFMVAYIPATLEKGQIVDESMEDIEFFLQEHAIAQGSDLFGSPGISGIFISSKDIQKPSGIKN